MSRINPTPSQKQRLLEANASRCCVCKRSNIGFNFHHIDADSSNTVDKNLAVLCVEDHDVHHRPGEYEARTKHLELDAKEILRFKNSWEAFVTEARKPNPKVIATLSCYGTEELIHSLQLVLQWPDERIEYKRSFHLLDGDLVRLTDEVSKELVSISPGIIVAVIDAPLPVEHCPCCGTGFSRTMRPAVVARLTDPTWLTESSCCIYINPTQPSLALVFFLRERQLLAAAFTSARANTSIIIAKVSMIVFQLNQSQASVLKRRRSLSMFLTSGHPQEFFSAQATLMLPCVFLIWSCRKSGRKELLTKA